MRAVKSPPAELASRLVGASAEILRPGRELRLEDVAALVGSARATLYYYFSGRDDLIGFLLQEHVTAASAAVDAAVRPDEPPAGQLRDAVVALAEFLGHEPGVCAGLLSFAGASDGLRSVLATKDALLVTPLQEILARGAAAGEFSAGDPVDAANAILGAMMIAILGRWNRGGDSTAPAFQQALTDQIVRGVRPEPA
jgi:TetR/AcrR family transcriptional regulator